MPNFNGIWSLRQQMQALSASLWPGRPGAPTSVVATQASSTSASVTFTAPANTGSLTITGYRVTASPGGVTATGSSSPITVSGLTAGSTYTFTVEAQNSSGYGPASAASNSLTLNSQSYTNRVSFSYTGSDQSWTVPAGVQALRVKAWGAGGTGGGNSSSNNGGTGLGGLSIDCGISVTPGESLTFRVGQAVAYVGSTGSCSVQNTGYGGGGSGSSGAGGTGDSGGQNGNSGGSGAGSSAVVRAGTLICAAGGGGGGGGASPQGAGQNASVATGGTGGTRTGNGNNGGTGTNYSGGGGGGGSGSSQGGSGANAGRGGGNLTPSLPANYPYTQNSYNPSGTTPGNSSDSDRGSSGVGGSSQSAGTNGVIVIYY